MRGTCASAITRIADREAEAAVYFCCTEAVHNAASAAASACTRSIDVAAAGGG